MWEDDDVPLFTEETYRRYAARIATKGTVQAATGMWDDDDDDVPCFDGTHRAVTVQAATGISDDDDEVAVVSWNANNKSS
jgi:uncharacterized protein YbaA (DUF1428 family)